jgi:O-antigen/teichoic acid export membrane protein
MRSLHFTIAKNALANVMRGGASAVVAIVLPHFLTRSLGADRFAGWALMLQLAAYANYLDFGVQTAVARYLAGALEKGDRELRDRLLTNAVAILSAGGAIAISGLVIVAWQLPHLFRSVPLSLSGEIGSGILILGILTGVGLPLSAYTGALIGMQRNEFPALAIAGSRILGAAAVVFVVHWTHSLAWLALCIALPNLASGFVQYTIAKRLLPGIRFRSSRLNRGMTMELIRYCSTLSVWSVGMLLVSGLDVTIVGLFNFQAVGAYSIAATLVMFFSGMNNAAFSAMLAPVAVMQARGDYASIRRLILLTTRLSSYFSIAVVAAVFLFGEALVRAWVGPSYLSVALPVLEILLLGQAIRLTGNAYATALVGMGLQRYGILPVLVEGLSNLLLSVLGMLLIGATGVAWATLVAASVALMIVVFVVLPRITALAINGKVFIMQGIVIPLLPFTFVFVWICVRHWYEMNTHAGGILSSLPDVVVFILTIALLSRSIKMASRVTL